MCHIEEPSSEPENMKVSEEDENVKDDGNNNEHEKSDNLKEPCGFIDIYDHENWKTLKWVE